MTLTREQLRSRKSHVGSSDIGPIFGWSPHKTAIDVWQDKRTPIKDKPPEQVWPDIDMDILRGQCLEGGIVQMGKALLGPGWKVRQYPCPTLTHPIEPLFVATPDALMDGPGDAEIGIPFEIKCPRYRAMDKWHDDDGALIVPNYVLTQVMSVMSVIGAPYAIVGVFIGDELRLQKTPFDPQLWADIVRVCKDFWDNHVVTGVPPPPDASAGYADYLSGRYQQTYTSMAPPCPESVQAAKDLCEATSIYNAAKTRMEVAKNTLKDLIGESAGIDFGTAGKVTWKETKGRRTVDYPAILSAYNIEPDPELVEQHTRIVGASRRFVNDLKGAKL